MVIVTGEVKQQVISTLSDSDSRRIITAVFEESKTIGAIEKELGLPQSTLYRKISEMRRCGLLMVDRFVIRPDGKREAVYARSFDEVRLRSEKQDIQLEIIESAT